MSDPIAPVTTERAEELRLWVRHTFTCPAHTDGCECGRCAPCECGVAEVRAALRSLAQERDALEADLSAETMNKEEWSEIEGERSERLRAALGNPNVTGKCNCNGCVGGRLVTLAVAAIRERDEAVRERDELNESFLAVTACGGGETHPELPHIERCGKCNDCLKTALNEWTAECICGCPMVDHETYEEGIGCGEDHTCLYAAPAVVKLFATAEAALAAERKRAEKAEGRWNEFVERLQRVDPLMRHPFECSYRFDKNDEPVYPFFDCKCGLKELITYFCGVRAQADPPALAAPERAQEEEK